MTGRLVIIEGIVGSTAYGLAHEESDVDRLGVFVAPTEEVVGLGWTAHKETVVSNNPDRTLHEVGKFLRLALKANPTITELLWLPTWETLGEPGRTILRERGFLLGARCVRASYGGYAAAQVKKLERRGDGTFSSDTRNRTAKHARHIYRLLLQGEQLLRIGQLTVRLSPEDADRAREMGEMATQGPDALSAFMAAYEAAQRRLDGAANTSGTPP